MRIRENYDHTQGVMAILGVTILRKLWVNGIRLKDIGRPANKEYNSKWAAAAASMVTVQSDTLSICRRYVLSLTEAASRIA